ncbi:DUF4123 domain-containing protein [Marinobacter confluentis]|uniref:DUF4123 domain-containing protein n=1 Tax=Marinobacter confluentis TaxID=1697557 RepID=A0A4Z1C6E5_9GAMM|nr:DUF4123 domain-containing protein [Marinobacter confluentis]TGN38855.1 DUF4123 domain-containing protein [Marinobacter confluentis]
MSDPSGFREQLQAASQALDNRGALYLVLSGTSEAKPVRHFYGTDGLTAVPLFQGTPYAGWHEVMPFLVQVTDTSGFLDWVDDTDAADWGWGLISDATLGEVFGHVRSLTKILLPDGKEVFFRYWDPRYLGALLSGVEDTCRANLMGPAQSIVLPDGEVINHPGTPGNATPAPEFPWFSLSAETLKKIAVLCWSRLVDNTISALGKKKHSPLIQYPGPVARQKVERQLRRLTSGEAVTELSPEHVQTIHHALLHEASRGTY